MPFPSSFETIVPLDLRGHERLDPTRVTTLLERTLRADGAMVSNNDGTYFEFERPAIDTLFPALVRGGAIRTEQVGDAMEVRAEVDVRLAPGLLLLVAFTVLSSIVGARPMDTALSFLVSGGVIQFFYFKAVVSFSRYVHDVCGRLGLVGNDPSSVRNLV
jgi:hypothetical protein